MARAIERKNRRIMVTLVVVVVGMIGLSYAAVPLYRIFCQVTGFGGTTQVADAPSGVITDRVMTVRFDANINGIPWRFQPVQQAVETRVGESMLVYYRAQNSSGQPVTGTATFNVTPMKAGQYFNKIECFCFTEQRLEPGQAIDMPVTFFIDPAIEQDRSLNDVKTITLSYTFFPVEDPEDEDTPRPVSDAGAGRSAAGVN